MMKALGFFKGAGKGGGVIPAPVPRDQASATLDVVRDVQDRRSLKRSGRTVYFGVRVVEGFKEECEGLAGELSAAQRKRVTVGAVMDEMLAAFHMVRGKQGAGWKAIEEIAAREGLEPKDVVQHLIAEKIEGYRDSEGGSKRKRA